MTFAFPQSKIIFMGIAILVSYSRIYNGVHYPFDVFAGGLMGVFYGWLFYLWLQKLMFYFKKDSL